MLTDSVLERLDHLSIALRDYARGGAGGVRRSKMLGSSAEFSDFREYVPGDDIRRIDWNAFARFDRLFLKLFMEEQEMCLSIVLDASRSMLAKWQFSVQLAQALAYLALRGGDKVLLIAIGGGGERRSRVFSGRAGFLGASQFLDAMEPAGEAALDAVVPGMHLPPRGLCAVISDLMMEGEGERALMSIAYRRQQLALLHVLSGDELRPELSGALRLVDAETANGVELMMDRAAMEEYERALGEFLGRAKARASKLGASYSALDAEIPLMDALMNSLAGAGIIR